MDPRCGVEGCGLPCTLGHLLNHCSKTLDRFKFRHKYVLNHMLKRVSDNKPENMEVCTDLQGWKVNGGTVPPSQVLTGQVTDLVMVERSSNPVKVALLELTVTFDNRKNLKEATERKEEQYRRLTAELKDARYAAMNIPLETGSQGVVSARNFGVLTTIAQLTGIRDIKNFRRTTSV